MNSVQKREFCLKDYQHEKDISVMTQIMNSEPFEKISKFVVKNHIEEICLYSYYSSCIQLNAKTAPKINEMLHRACAQFGVETIPDILLCREYDETVQIIGFSKPALLFSSVYLDQLDDITLYGVLCGQIAGIKAQHQKTLFMIWVLENITGMLPFLGLTGTALIKRLLNEWRRNRFLTYDRAFYLATRDKERSLRQIFIPYLLKGILEHFPLGTDSDPYQKQVERFFHNDPIKLAGKEAHSISSDNSWLPVRYKELLSFMQERGNLYG